MIKTKLTRGGDSEVRLPGWAWAVFTTLLLGLVTGTGTAANWMVQSVLETSEQQQVLTVRVGHNEKALATISEKLDRILERLPPK